MLARSSAPSKGLSVSKIGIVLQTAIRFSGMILNFWDSGFFQVTYSISETLKLDGQLSNVKQTWLW